MSRHLTYRFWLCLSSSVVGLLAAVVGQSPESLAFALPFFWALVISLVDGWWPAAKVSGTAISSQQIIEGDTFEYLIEVEAKGRLPWVEVEVQLPGVMKALGPTRFIGPIEGQQQFRVPVCAGRWGVHGPEWVTVLTRDRLGMTSTFQQLPLAERLRVHPPTEHLSNLVSLARTRLVTGEHRSRRRGGGTEMAEVRPYRQGDPVRSIHTRISGRRGAPFVVDRHPEQASDIVLFIDSVQDIGVDLDTSLRLTVTAAIALTKRHMRAMDRVGLIDRGAGVRWLDPSMGRKAQHAIVDSLLDTAVLRMDAQEPSIPLARIPSGATIFAISPLLSAVVFADLVAACRRGHEVIVVQPSSAAGDGTSLANRIIGVSNEVRRRELLHAGVLVIPWDRGQPLDQTLAQADLTLARHRAPRAMVGGRS